MELERPDLNIGSATFSLSELGKVVDLSGPQFPHL